MSGINLERDEVLKANVVFKAIQALSKIVEMYFSKCPDCNGTGCYDVVGGFKAGGKSWSTLFCSTCRGAGYIGWEESNVFYICENCGGKGCKTCGNRGYSDWVQNAKGE